MADDRQALLDKLAELDKKELGAEAVRNIQRLHAIRAEASLMIVQYNDSPKAQEPADLFLKAANLAEEAAQLGVRLSELRNA